MDEKYFAREKIFVKKCHLILRSKNHVNVYKALCDFVYCKRLTGTFRNMEASGKNKFDDNQRTTYEVKTVFFYF